MSFQQSQLFIFLLIFPRGYSQAISRILWVINRFIHWTGFQNTSYFLIYAFMCKGHVFG